MHGSLWQGWDCLTAREFLLRGGAAILADSFGNSFVNQPKCSIITLSSMVSQVLSNHPDLPSARIRLS
jgi:hypothetical protein